MDTIQAATDESMKAIIYIIMACSLSYAGSTVDTFGITKFYPTKANTREWNSAHWHNGISRTFKYAPDPYDPTGWTEDHSSGTDGFRVDGKGMMRMSGGGPRFHINSLITTKVPAQKFHDIEYTAYYRRLGAKGANWGGAVVGLRSGPLGHASPGGNDCDATTYYGRFRNDGTWDFEKELKHPGSTYWSGSGFNTQDPLWHGATLPINRWIGMKFLVFNIENNTQVRLSIYIDSVSNGAPRNGGHWDKVGEVIDAGAWSSGDVGGCNYIQTMVITDGGGTVLLRTDNDTADYTLVSVREIDVSGGPLATISNQNFQKNSDMDRMRNPYSLQLMLDPLHRQGIPGGILDLRGRTTQGSVPAGAHVIPFNIGNQGVRLLLIGKESKKGS
jgi:hypothetical protein